MPAPIPAFAPVDIPAGTSDVVGISGLELDDVGASLTVDMNADVAEVIDADVSDVADAVVEVDLSTNTVPTTAYSVAFRSHVAQTFGLDGRTLNLPTPLLQQFGLWSQQKEVSLFVTLEHEIKSVPPVSAPLSRISIAVQSQGIALLTQTKHGTLR